MLCSTGVYIIVIIKYLQVDMQIAYDHCLQFILNGPLMDNFCENVNNYVIPDKLQCLSIFKVSFK